MTAKADRCPGQLKGIMYLHGLPTAIRSVKSDGDSAIRKFTVYCTVQYVQEEGGPCTVHPRAERSDERKS